MSWHPRGRFGRSLCSHLNFKIPICLEISVCTTLRVRTHLINRATPHCLRGRFQWCVQFTSESWSQKGHHIWVDNAPAVYWTIGVVSRVSWYLLLPTAQYSLRVTATRVVVDVAQYCQHKTEWLIHGVMYSLPSMLINEADILNFEPGVIEVPLTFPCRSK